MPNTHTSSPARIITAACIGNALEWYDIVVYSYFAVYISHAFFPSHSSTASLLLTFGTFALSYFIRPVGALILGSYADRVGRKPALTITILMMTVGTGLMAVVPSYATIGVAAPLLILLSRLIQGFSAGGEFGSATALMLEHLPSRRGFAASWQFTSQGLSTLLAAGMGVTLTTVLSDASLNSWGFRLPFVFGMLVGPAGLYIRRRVPESAEFEAGKKNTPSRAPLTLLFANHLPRVLLVIGIGGLGSALTYTVSYIPTYSINTLGLPAQVGFMSVIAAGVFQILFYPVSGHLSDRFGRSRQMLPGAILVGVLIFPILGFVVAWPSLVTLIVALAGIVAFKSWYSAPSAALSGEVFPVEVRGIGMSFSYNAGVAVFGGLTPFMATLLISVTHNALAPSFWLMATSLVAIGCLIILRIRRWDHYTSPRDPSGTRGDETAPADRQQ